MELYRIFICGLSPSVQRDDLQYKFNTFGEIYHFHFHADQGYTLISYANQKDAILAIVYGNGMIIEGYPIQVQWARRWPKDRNGYKDMDSVYNGTWINNCTIDCCFFNNTITIYELEEIFSPFGMIEDIYMKNNYRDHVLIRFERKTDATLAICTIDGTKVDGRVVSCEWSNRPIHNLVSSGWRSTYLHENIEYEVPYQPVALPSPSKQLRSILKNPTVSSSASNTASTSSKPLRSILKQPDVSSATSNSALRTPTVSNTSSSFPEVFNIVPRASVVSNTASRAPVVSNTSSRASVVSSTASSFQEVFNKVSRAPVVSSTASRAPVVSSTASRASVVSSTATSFPVVSNTASRDKVVSSTASRAKVVSSTASRASVVSSTTNVTPVASGLTSLISDIYNLQQSLLNIGPSLNIPSHTSAASNVYQSSSALSNERNTNDDFDTVFNQTSQQNCTIYCKGLNLNTTIESLKKIFSPFGIVEEICLYIDKSDYALIRFNTKEAATLAICSINNTKINGCLVICTWSNKPNSQNHQEQATSVGQPPSTTFMQSFSQSPTATALSKKERNGAAEKRKERAPDMFCKICMDEELGVVFVPCGHLIACAKCAQQIYTCPLCRKYIMSKVRTYLG